jgi:hypothetical protein
MRGVCGFSPEGEAGIAVFVHQLSPVAARMTDFPSRRAATAGVDPNFVALPSSRRGTKNLDAGFHRHDAL